MNVWEGAFAARGARVKMYVWEGAFAAARVAEGTRRVPPPPPAGREEEEGLGISRGGDTSAASAPIAHQVRSRLTI